MPLNRLATVLALLSLIAVKPALSAGSEAEPLATITALDVPRYMGRWYEIAKYPNWFQKKCVGDTSAEYSLKLDGTVQVVNRCRMDNGEWNEAVESGDRLDRVERNPEPVTLADLLALWAQHRPDPDRLVAVSRTPGLTVSWVTRLQDRAERLRQIGTEEAPQLFRGHPDSATRKA